MKLTSGLNSRRILSYTYVNAQSDLLLVFLNATGGRSLVLPDRYHLKIRLSSTSWICLEWLCITPASWLQPTAVVAAKLQSLLAIGKTSSRTLWHVLTQTYLRSDSAHHSQTFAAQHLKILQQHGGHRAGGAERPVLQHSRVILHRQGRSCRSLQERVSQVFYAC